MFMARITSTICALGALTLAAITLSATGASAAEPDAAVQVGPAQFSNPEAVIHQDHVYVAKIQPRVSAAAVDLRLGDGETLELIRDGDYVYGF